MCKLFLIVFFSFISFTSYSNEKSIIIASTTSAYDSGLLTYLNNFFTDKYKINVKVLALGTGQALRTAMDGNVEILIVHHKQSEIEFMNKGFGLLRYELMYNDYLIVGPKNDKTICFNIESKLKEIFNNNYEFISRGDDSGTHKKEVELWKENNFNPLEFGNFYIEVGQGMGNTLLITNEKSAYTITDRSTWLSFKKKENLKIICESNPPLFNQYGVILVNPSINNLLNTELAKIYINWLISEEGKELINNFTKKGKQLFFYNYNLN